MRRRFQDKTPERLRVRADSPKEGGRQRLSALTPHDNTSENGLNQRQRPRRWPTDRPPRIRPVILCKTRHPAKNDKRLT